MSLKKDGGSQSPSSKKEVAFGDLPEDEEIAAHIPLDHHAGSFHRLSRSKLQRMSSIGPIVEEPKDIKFPSCRIVLMALAFFGFLNIYCLRVNLSVAIVAMVKHVEPNVTHVTNATIDDCGNAIVHKNKSSTVEGDFLWNENMQGVILAAFFYGYVTTQIPGGMLAQKFGGKRLLLFGVFWTALLTILTPIFTRLGGFGALVATRVLEGIGEGVTYPSMHAMLSQWAPPQERSKMVTSVYAGAQIGTVLAMPLSGLLCEYVSWDSVFYVFGALGIVWSILWLFLTYDTPAQHPRIDPKERTYIETSQGLLGTKKPASMRVPWLEIAKSPPVYATAIAHFANNWGYYTLLTCLPTYLKNILHFDMKSNGLLSGLPYLVMWMVMIASGLIADVLRTKHILTTTNVRKVANGVGFIGPAICLIITGFIECSKPLAVTMIVIAVGLSGISMAGWAVNHLDLAPPYAGTLMGITNGIATIPGFLSPTVVGLLTDGNQTPAAWRNVFYIAAAVYLFGTIFYCVFGSGQRQSWAVQVDKEEDGQQSPKAQEKADTHM